MEKIQNCVRSGRIHGEYINKYADFMLQLISSRLGKGRPAMLQMVKYEMMIFFCLRAAIKIGFFVQLLFHNLIQPVAVLIVHRYINVIIPGNKAFMPQRSDEGAEIQVIFQVMFAADAVKLLQKLQLYQLNSSQFFPAGKQHFALYRHQRMFYLLSGIQTKQPVSVLDTVTFYTDKGDSLYIFPEGSF